MSLLSYIQPNGTIKLLQNIPLDSTYEHTIYFSTILQQERYFNQQRFNPVSFTNQSYTRVSGGVIRIQANFESIINANYLIFKNLLTNTTGGNKWYYAFIMDLIYVNNNVTEVHYQIDVMQTWFFDYTLNQCFVEREHSSTDHPYEHYLDEGLATGSSYTIANKTTTKECKKWTQPAGDDTTYDTNKLVPLIMINRVNEQDTHDHPHASAKIFGIYTPVRLLTTTQENWTAADLDNLLNDFNEGDIVNIYEYPLMFNPTASSPEKYRVKLTPVIDKVGGHTIRNKKLLSYPYNFILVDNNCGQTAEYRFEDWGANATVGLFELSGCPVTTPAMMLSPYDYRGLSGATNYHEGVMYTNFPNCAWAGDTYKAWWAQNKASAVTGLVSSAFSSVANIVGGFATAGMGLGAGMLGASGGSLSFGGSTLMSSGGLMNMGAGMMMGGVSQVGTGTGSLLRDIMSFSAKQEDLMHTPSQTYGHAQGDSINSMLQLIQFNIFQIQIKKEYAEALDDFFDRFGYACRKNKVPNRAVRKYWCYTKTCGCTLTDENMPTTAADAICKIYDNGITFWKASGGETAQDSPSVTCDVGNYSLDNTIHDQSN